MAVSAMGRAAGFERATRGQVAPAYKGNRRAFNKGLAAALAALGLGLGLAGGARPAFARGPLIVVLGDSLSAGFGLTDMQNAFPARLETALRGRRIDAQVVNAGVSGDTSAGGRSRLGWSLLPNTDLMIVELGANDALRGLNPAATYANLDAILADLNKRNVPTLLAGMLAPPNLGEEYGTAFAGVFTRLAAAYPVTLYPFFLDGVAAQRELLQADGKHPNEAGVEVIVVNILPTVLKALGGK